LVEEKNHGPVSSEGEEDEDGCFCLLSIEKERVNLNVVLVYFESRR
jgi:hypothetical protein